MVAGAFFGLESLPTNKEVEEVKRLAILCVALLSASLLMIIAVCCQKAPEIAWPAPTIEPELAIPADFVTYTDELALFSISYPPDWELNLEQMEAVSWHSWQAHRVKTATGLSIEEAVFLFVAGRPVGKGLDPNVNIGLFPNPDIQSLDDLAEQCREQATFYEEYQPFKEIRTTVGGREALIFDAEFVISQDLGRDRSLQLHVIQGETEWIVTCLTGPEQFPAEEETLHRVARSFRILK